jgi:hypothetical protein
MRLHHLIILGSYGVSKPQSTYNRNNGTLSRKKDTKSDPYPNYFKFPLLHFVNFLFILQITASNQLKTRGSVHSMAYWKFVPHAQNPEEFQNSTVSKDSDGTQVIPGNGILLLVFSFSPL